MENIDRAARSFQWAPVEVPPHGNSQAIEKRKHVKSASTILFIFATENARIIVIFQNAKSRPIAFLA
jgi:hypothetical protein